MIRYRSLSGDVYEAALINGPRQDGTASIEVAVPGTARPVQLDHTMWSNRFTLRPGRAWRETVE